MGKATRPLKPCFQNVTGFRPCDKRAIHVAMPEPVKNRDGQFYSTIRVPGVSSPRLCTLLRWMTGRHRYRRLGPRHVTQLGCLMARLHQRAQHWKPPSTFQRRRWDWDGLFGAKGGFGVPAGEAWARLPEPYYTLMRRVADEAGEVMQTLGTGPEVFGLIHSDLGLGNVLFAGGEARAIDFDDCGFGYWLYDMAATLRRWRWTADWSVYHHAFLRGYTEIQPWPTALCHALDTLMAARSVSVALWAVGKANDHSGLRQHLTSWLDEAAGFINRYNQRKHEPG